MLELFTPEFIAKLSPETLRGLGVSEAPPAPAQRDSSAEAEKNDLRRAGH